MNTGGQIGEPIYGSTVVPPPPWAVHYLNISLLREKKAPFSGGRRCSHGFCFLCNRETCVRTPSRHPGSHCSPIVGCPGLPLPPPRGATGPSINSRTMQRALIEPSKGCLHGNIARDPRRALNRHRIFFQTRRRRSSPDGIGSLSLSLSLSFSLDDQTTAVSIITFP